jgi:hypothetical protein
MVVVVQRHIYTSLAVIIIESPVMRVMDSPSEDTRRCRAPGIGHWPMAHQGEFSTGRWECVWFSPLMGRKMNDADVWF